MKGKDPGLVINELITLQRRQPDITTFLIKVHNTTLDSQPPK